MLLLVYLDLRGYLRLHIIWVAGTRQIGAGIDYFSRGCLTEKISPSGSILEFVTLNETAFDILASLLTWVHTWIGVNTIETLTHVGWFK